LFAVMLVATVAHAQDHKKAARLKYDRAITEYNLQNWEGALRDFQEAYREHSDPAILFNIGQCQRQLGEYEAAAKSYRLYLAQAPGAPNAEQVSRLIVQMDEAAREKHAQAPPVAPQAELPPPPATTAAAVEVAPAPRRPWYKDPAGLALAGAGVAAVVAGGALLGVAGSEGDSAARATTQASFDLHHGNDLTYQKAGWPILGVGLAAITVGSIVLALRGTRHR
jgi:tetratricopeptide (TPR) repeat protein